MKNAAHRGTHNFGVGVIDGVSAQYYIGKPKPVRAAHQGSDVAGVIYFMQNRTFSGEVDRREIKVGSGLIWTIAIIPSGSLS